MPSGKMGNYIKCLQCDKSFYAAPSRIKSAKYCSVSCAAKYKKIWEQNRNGIYKTCLVCKKEFYVPGYRKESGKFCSIKCLNHGQYKKLKRICLNCEKVFFVSKSRKRRKFCSEECGIESRKKYLTEREFRRIAKRYVTDKRGRNSSRNTRLKAFYLYKPICSACGYKEYKFCLDIHHRDGNPDNNEADNLLILCVFCHRKYHRKMLKIENLKNIALSMARQHKA